MARTPRAPSPEVREGRKIARAIEIGLQEVLDGIQCDFVHADEETVDDLIEIHVPDRLDFAPVWIDIGRDGIMTPGAWISRDQEVADLGKGTRSFRAIVEEVAGLLLAYGWASPKAPQPKPAGGR